VKSRGGGAERPAKLVGVDLRAPQPDLRALLAERGLAVTHVERGADLARGSLQRILGGRRGGDSLYTAEKLAKVLGLPLETVAAAILASVTESRERQRQVRAATLAQREAAHRR
jgi:transcriptional regulator with XRE-family HTH domain